MVFPAPGEVRQEQKRLSDPTVMADDDPELLEEQADDAFARYYAGEIEPRVQITTSGREDVSRAFCASLEVLIPHARFISRTGTITEVIEAATVGGFSDLLIVNEALGQVHEMLHIHLPRGPCVNWRVTTILLPTKIPNHARTSQHYPEVQMKHFETRLGKLCGRMLRALFPLTAHFTGRRVVVMHQQRDFVFVRHYRYAFESRDDATLQEAGPRFTLRVLWVMEGPFDPAFGVFTFYRRPRFEKSRLRWWL